MLSRIEVEALTSDTSELGRSTIQHLGLEGFDAIEGLVRASPFNPFRNYHAFTPRAREDALAAEARAILGRPGSFAVAARCDEAVGIALGSRLEWDSSFFDVPMARLNLVAGGGAEVRRDALRAALTLLRIDGVRHVAARADIADPESVALLGDMGFRLMGSLSTYVARSRQELVNPVRSFGKIRHMRDDDGPGLIALASEAFRDLNNRFEADPGLPRERVRAFYPEWARRCATREMADVVFVSQGREDDLLGFLAFRRLEPLSTATGLPVFGGGLGACRRGASGAYAGLVRTAVAWALDHGGIAEIQTPSDNFAAVAVFARVGLHLRRAEYAFHLWLS